MSTVTPSRPKGLTARELLRATHAMKEGESPSNVLSSLQSRALLTSSAQPPAMRTGSSSPTTVSVAPRTPVRAKPLASPSKSERTPGTSGPSLAATPVEEPANSESPPASPVGAAVAREREAAAAAEVGRPTTGVEAEAAAIAIQGRVRGAQARRRAAAKKLVLSRQGDAAEDTSRLDVDVGEWLEAHNEPDIADELRVDFDCDTLRDLLAIIQDPADCGMIIPDDPARCDALWKALQQEISEGLQALKSPVEPIRPEAPVIPPPGDSDLPTEFGLVHVSGLRGSLQEERHVKSLFSEFGTVQAVKLKIQPRKGASWALVTFMDSAEAQRAVDAALAINAKYPGVVTRKVDELPLRPQTGYGMLEIMKSHKRAHVFTKDTQALVDTDAFATEIGEDLPDDVAVRAMEATAAAAPTTCSCGAVHWPSCPLNPVHGDPTEFLRLRRMAKMTFAVAMVQAHWRGFAVRKKARSQEGSSPCHTDPPPPPPRAAAIAMGQPTASGGGGAAAAADARAWRESSGAGGAAVPTGRNEALPEVTTAAAVAVRGDDPYDNIQNWLREGPMLLEALGDSDPALKQAAGVAAATVGALAEGLPARRATCNRI